MNQAIIDSFPTGGLPITLFVVLIAWTVVWKGIALWKAAQLSHKKWFIVLLLSNTIGILDIIYIRFIAKKYTVETVDKTGEKA